MAAPASPVPEDRGQHKRLKPDDGPDDPHGSRPSASYTSQQMPPHHRYPPPPPPTHYGGPAPPAPSGPNGGYNMWGAPYSGSHPHPSAGYPMYSQRGPPPPGDRPSPDYYRPGGPVAMPRSSQTTVGSQTPADGRMDDRRNPSQPYPSWSHHAPQWHNASYGPPPPPPPPGWQGPSSGGPVPHKTYPPQHHLPHHSGNGQPMPPVASGPMHPSTGPVTGGWGSSSRSPPRGGRLRHDGPYGRPELDMSYMTSRPVGVMMDDEMEGSSTGGSTKDKGRGSYKCGRCGVPKKGHVCPYQPKLKRRPDEPLPETRNAAIQVEMDEFMTIRRLNLKIQGLPESYATEPYSNDPTCMVIGEPAHHSAPTMGHSSIPHVDHLPPIPAHLQPDDMTMMGMGSHNVTAAAPLPLDDDELIDPNLGSPSSPLPANAPGSPHLLSKDVAIGDDVPDELDDDDDDAPLAMGEEKKE